ncbi:uncharacterized protein LOC142585951 isoform X3 [Dermacentor variabilis]|uniref:uncharacterized protein LOC142585951 isoform X3 n=1 Tax=Dermacentor variabilis TaxID=34621 RepID=UPI003F5BD833
MGCRSLWLLLTFSGLLVAPLEALSFKDYRKRLLSFNPAALTPQCRIVFQKCAPKLLSMVHVLDNVSKRWKEYEAVRCQLTDEVMDVYIERSKLAPALECLLENAND